MFLKKRIITELKPKEIKKITSEEARLITDLFLNEKQVEYPIFENAYLELCFELINGYAKTGQKRCPFPQTRSISQKILTTLKFVHDTQKIRNMLISLGYKFVPTPMISSCGIEKHEFIQDWISWE